MHETKQEEIFRENQRILDAYIEEGNQAIAARNQTRSVLIEFPEDWNNKPRRLEVFKTWLKTWW
jgi:hypothetical protein